MNTDSFTDPSVICVNHYSLIVRIAALTRCGMLLHRVCLSVCLSVAHVCVRPAKTNNVIDMQFGMVTRVDPKTHILEKGPVQIRLKGGVLLGIFGPLKSIGTLGCTVECAAKEMSFISRPICLYIDVAV